MLHAWDRIPIKYFTTAYLAVLFFVGVMHAGGLAALVKGAVAIAVYGGADMAWTRLRHRKWYVPLSSLISGLILALVASPLLPMWAFVALPLVAVLSKHALHFGRPRHVLNPAALSLGVCSFFFPATISWWGASWAFGSPLFFVAVFAGIFIAFRQSRWHQIVVFLGIFALLHSVEVLLQGGGLERLQKMFEAVFLHGTLLFFATVMLIEPITSEFPKKSERMAFGALAAFFAFFVQLASRFSFALDPLIFGLLAANSVARFLFAKRNR